LDDISTDQKIITNTLQNPQVCSDRRQLQYLETQLLSMTKQVKLEQEYIQVKTRAENQYLKDFKNFVWLKSLHYLTDDIFVQFLKPQDQQEGDQGKFGNIQEQFKATE